MYLNGIRDLKKAGKDDAQNERPSSHRTEENMDRVKRLINSDGRQNVRVMAEELKLDRETVRKILSADLGMRKISAKMVPRILSREQK